MPVPPWYRTIPKIGVGFLLTVIAIRASWQSGVVLRGGANRLVRLAGMTLSAGTLVAFAVSRTPAGLFNFREVGFHPSPQAALARSLDRRERLLLRWITFVMGTHVASPRAPSIGQELVAAARWGSVREQETVRRLHAVDAESYADWETIYLDNVQRLYRLMYSRVGNRPDAEDLTSEVFMAHLEPLSVSASKPEVRPYLIATARTVLAGYGAEPPDGGDVRSTSTPPSDHRRSTSPAERSRRSGQARPRQIAGAVRRILELRFLRSMSLKEVATEMRITVGNVKVLQHRALRLAAEAGKDVVP